MGKLLLKFSSWVDVTLLRRVTAVGALLARSGMHPGAQQQMTTNVHIPQPPWLETFLVPFLCARLIFSKCVIFFV